MASLPDFSSHVGSTLGRSPHTAKAYVSDVRSLARFLSHAAKRDASGGTPPLDLASTFVTWLRVDEGNGPATVKRKMAALHIYFTWMIRVSIRPGPPWRMWGMCHLDREYIRDGDGHDDVYRYV